MHLDLHQPRPGTPRTGRPYVERNRPPYRHLRLVKLGEDPDRRETRVVLGFARGAVRSALVDVITLSMLSRPLSALRPGMTLAREKCRPAM